MGGKCILLRMRHLLLIALVVLAPIASRSAGLDWRTFRPEPGTDPTNSAAHEAFTTGLSAMEQDDFARAQIAFATAVAADPTHAEAQWMLGLCTWLSGNLREAGKYFVRAARSPSRPAPPCFALAATALQRGARPEALGWYRKGLARCREDQRAAWESHPLFEPLRQWEAEQREPPAPSEPESGSVQHVE